MGWILDSFQLLTCRLIWNFGQLFISKNYFGSKLKLYSTGGKSITHFYMYILLNITVKCNTLKYISWNKNIKKNRYNIKVYGQSFFNSAEAPPCDLRKGKITFVQLNTSFKYAGKNSFWSSLRYIQVINVQ